jgi:hypothetical protein
LKLADLQ